jgi:hypothetical protein
MRSISLLRTRFDVLKRVFAVLNRTDCAIDQVCVFGRCSLFGPEDPAESTPATRPAANGVWCLSGQLRAVQQVQDRGKGVESGQRVRHQPHVDPGEPVVRVGPECGSDLLG